MKGSTGVTVLLIIVFFVILGMVGYIFFIKPQTTQQSSTNNSQTAQPTIAEKDFAPGVPMSQKTTILIQSSDSSEIKYIVPTNQVDIYIKQLPSGYHVVSKTP